MRPNSGSRLIGFFPKDTSFADVFECLFESAPEAIYILDRHGRFVAVNRRAEELTGFKREDYIGKSFRKVISAKSFPKAIRGFVSVIRGKSIRLKLELKTAAEKTVLAEVTSTPFVSNGKIVGALGIVRDITERKKLEETLESERYLKTILNSIFSGVIVIDGETHEIAYANPKALEIIGAPRERVIGKVCHRFICTAEEGRCPITDLRQTVDKSERALLTADGKKIPILKTATTIMWRNHRYLIESFMDITERKHMEKELGESEERYRTQFEEAIDAIVVADAETGIIIDCNRAASELVGTEKSGLVGKHQRILHPPEEIDGEFSRTFKEHLKEKEGQVLETKVITRNGEIRDVAIKANVLKLGDRKAVQGVFRDITEQKKAEEALRRSEEEAKRLLEFQNKFIDTAVVWIHLLDAEGNATVWNRAAELISGYSREEVIGNEKIWEWLYPDPEYRAECLRKGKEITKKGTRPDSCETIVRCKDGTLKTVSWYSNNILDEKGTSMGSIAVGIDVTKQKRMAQELAYEHDLLQTLMDNIPDTIYFKDAASRFTRINKAQARVLRVKDPADAIGKTDFDFFVEEHARNAYADEQRIVQTGQPLINKVEKIRMPDGGFWWVSATKVPIKSKEGRIIGTVGISRDMTEHKKMEEELRRYSDHLEELVEERTKELKEAQNRALRSERLAAIGELAGMVGHDLRNPLTGITGAAYYLKTKYGQEMDDKAQEMLGIIEKGIGYANNIINDLLEYSREIKLELTESNPKVMTREALSLLEIPENVRIVDLTEKEPKMKVDVDKLKRVFVNMIKNALDAMPEGGRLTIKSKKSNDHWEIAFSDTGKGMTRCMLEKLWQPLFTTKAKGMGFGLPICKRIVEAHGGKISVESAVAKGTTFTVAIPFNPLEREEKVWVNVPESLSTTTKARLVE